MQFHAVKCITEGISLIENLSGVWGQDFAKHHITSIFVIFASFKKRIVRFLDWKLTISKYSVLFYSSRIFLYFCTVFSFVQYSSCYAMHEIARTKTVTPIFSHPPKKCTPLTFY